MYGRVIMAESLDQRTCGDCGVIVTNRRDECPECGKSLLVTRKRKKDRPRLNPDDDPVDVYDRSFETRLEMGFSMLEWE
jgi:ribosomal protein S27AE